MKPTADELLVAIRAYCLECSGGSRKEVERCNIKYCKLRPYRSAAAVNGERPKEKRDAGQVSLFDVLEARV